MSVPSALKLREMRDKRKKPVKLKVELTYKQIKAAFHTLEERVLFRPGSFTNADALANAEEAYNVLGAYVRKFAVLVPEDERNFETKADKRGRKYLCSACAVASVPAAGEVCPNCASPGAA